MNQQALNNVCQQVYRRFPEVSGSQPKVQTRADNQFLLIFNGAAKAVDGRKIAHTVRVVASPDGKIVKVTTSRYQEALCISISFLASS
jgi:hypothetical protein